MYNKKIRAFTLHMCIYNNKFKNLIKDSDDTW